MDVIADIIKNKKETLTNAQNKKSKESLKKEAYDTISTRTNLFRFQEKLKDKNSTKLITEYKPASPSQGDISKLLADDVIPIYDESNADMISVLTEESYFKSNLENFKKAARLTNKPLLRKDFVIDEYMIYEAAANNASAVLLITGICPDMEGYLNICNDLGLDAIIECHSKEDMESVEYLNPKIIGINNRNLNNLTVDLNTTKELKDYVPNYLISESGVKNINDAVLLKEYGADAILIGTSVLKNNEKKAIKEYINELSINLKK